MRNDDALHDQLAAYALGALDPAEVMAIEAQLQMNPDLRTELASLRETVQMLPYAVQPVAPAAHVKRQLFARIAASQPAPAPMPQPTMYTGGGMARMVIGALVLALVLLTSGLGLVGWNVQQRIVALDTSRDQVSAQIATLQTQLATAEATLASTRDNQQALSEEIAKNQQEVAAIQTRLAQEQQIFTFVTAPGVATRALNAVEADYRAQGEMYMYPGHSEAVVLFRDLPTLEPGMIYQFWLADGQQQVAAGFVIADTNGFARLVLTAPREVNAFSQVMLTVEPSGGSPLPSEEVILAGSL